MTREQKIESFKLLAKELGYELNFAQLALIEAIQDLQAKLDSGETLVFVEQKRQVPYWLRSGRHG